MPSAQYQPCYDSSPSIDTGLKSIDYGLNSQKPWAKTHLTHLSLLKLFVSGYFGTAMWKLLKQYPVQANLSQFTQQAPLWGSEGGSDPFGDFIIPLNTLLFSDPQTSLGYIGTVPGMQSRGQWPWVKNSAAPNLLRCSCNIVASDPCCDMKTWVT